MPLPQARRQLANKLRSSAYALVSTVSYALGSSRLGWQIEEGVASVESIDVFPVVEECRRRWLKIIADARDEVFEDGTMSQLGEAVVGELSTGRRECVQALRWVIGGLAGMEERSAQALRWVGRVDDPRTEWERLLLVCEMIRSPSAKMRDAASLALCSMANPAALPTVESAACVEPIPELRQDLENLVSYLRERGSAVSSS